MQWFEMKTTLFKKSTYFCLQKLGDINNYGKSGDGDGIHKNSLERRNTRVEISVVMRMTHSHEPVKFTLNLKVKSQVFCLLKRRNLP